MKTTCTAKAKGTGERCRRAPIAGGTVCRVHGGAAGSVRAAAARRTAEAAAAAEMERAVVTLGLPVDVDPAKALLDEIHWCAGHVAWLRGKVQEIADTDLVWGRTQTDNGIGPQGPVDMSTEKAGANVWLELYNQERDRFHRVCALALKSGIEERRVKLAEQQGDLVAQVIKRILARLQLSPTQELEAPEIVRSEFRALAALEQGMS